MVYESLSLAGVSNGNAEEVYSSRGGNWPSSRCTYGFISSSNVSQDSPVYYLLVGLVMVRYLQLCTCRRWCLIDRRIRGGIGSGTEVNSSGRSRSILSILDHRIGTLLINLSDIFICEMVHVLYF